MADRGLFGHGVAAGGGRARQWGAAAAVAAVALMAAATEAGAADTGVKAEAEVEGLGLPSRRPGAGFWERDSISGDWGGARGRLSDRGINLGFEYLGELLANVSGGIRTGAVYAGRFEMAAELDLKKLAGLDGARIFANAYQIHGRGLSPDFLGNLLPASNIEAHPATRLFDLWLQQSFLDDRASVRIGQIAADDEFIVSDTAGNFLNGTFGWLALTANNLPSGGPAYPLAAPGVRVEAMPAQAVIFRSAVFSGDPAGKPGGEDPQIFNSGGTIFSFAGGVFWISELQLDASLGEAGLPGSYKLGGWYHWGSFDDVRRDSLGMSLAAPGSNGISARHRGNYAIYGVADQTVWREPGSQSRGLSIFTRMGGAPSDVNPADFYVDVGAAYRGLVPGRGADVLGAAFGYAHVSSSLHDLARDAGMVTGPGAPVPDFEAVIEIVYSARITPWWLLQPDVQYLFHPGGNVAHPGDPAGITAVPDAVVLGVRASLTF